VVDCDPTKDDEGNFLGVLSCGVNEYCMESKSSYLGGVCIESANLDRELQTQREGCYDLPKQEVGDTELLSECCVCATDFYVDTQLICDAGQGVSEYECQEYCDAPDCCDCSEWEDTTNTGYKACEKATCYDDCSGMNACLTARIYYSSMDSYPYSTETYCGDISTEEGKEGSFCIGGYGADDPFGSFTINDVPCEFYIDYSQIPVYGNYTNVIYGWDCSDTILYEYNGGISQQDPITSLFQYLNFDISCDYDNYDNYDNDGFRRQLGAKKGNKDSKKVKKGSKKDAKKGKKSSKKGRPPAPFAPTSRPTTQGDSSQGDSICLAPPTQAPIRSSKKSGKKGGKKGKKGKKEHRFRGSLRHQ
jgi:hypothetical protein